MQILGICFSQAQSAAFALSVTLVQVLPFVSVLAAEQVTALCEYCC